MAIHRIDVIASWGRYSLTHNTETDEYRHVGFGSNYPALKEEWDAVCEADFELTDVGEESVWGSGLVVDQT